MPNDPVVYRYAGPTQRRAPFPGVPMRDLTARDVAKLSPRQLKDITGGERPMYQPVQSKAAKEARAEAPAPTPASRAEAGEE